jgi:death-on-curing protein
MKLIRTRWRPCPMIELTAEMIIEIHDITIQRYGGLPGILCQGTIDYLVDRINDEPDHFLKAALALHLIALHPFNDGQKRTGFQVADNILRMNGLCISAGKESICRVLFTVAEYNCTLDAIEKWLRENTQQT